jgi:hypothetical protein
MSPCQVANPVLEPGHGLVGDASPRLRIVRDRKAKERSLRVPVDREHRFRLIVNIQSS